MEKKEIFISYSHHDHDEVDVITKKLEQDDISYFLDKHIETGAIFEEEIRDHLINCNEVFLLLSPKSLKSEWVTSEWSAAWALKKYTVPIMHQISPKQLPHRLASLQAKNLYKIDDIIKEYKKRRNKIAIPFEPSYEKKQRVLIFDIDGTVLKERDNFKTGKGIEIINIFRELINKGFYIVFITGNDFDIQNERLLIPIIENNLADSVFCFSDGGSRAFEFKKGKFEEIEDYSKDNLISKDKKDWIIQQFESEIDKFINIHNSLKRPNIRLYDRTLKYLDLIIRPIRPSFYKSEIFKKFCNEIEQITNNPEIKSPCELIKDVRNALIIRAFGKNPESDVIFLQDMINNLFYNKEYMEISLPEYEIRGGKVISQIAFKPFNDNKLRKIFRQTLENKLNIDNKNEFSVLLGGKTTIDLQLRNVDKTKAINFLRKYKGFNPDQMIYFGDEFILFGNDLPVSKMKDSERPSFIVHVGNRLETPFDEDVRKRIIIDGNGPDGTINYLKFLLNECR